MSKQGGLGDALYVSGYNLSGDVQSLSGVGGGPALLDFTDITQAANARQGGLRDGRIEWTSFFNPGLEANAAHTVLSVLPTSDAVVTYCRGTALGSPAACLVGKQIGYDGNRANDGGFTFGLSAQANGYGLEWGLLGTPGMRTDATATNGTALDNAAATTFGLQAYLHVAAVTGTSVTVKLQDSTDNTTFNDVVGGSFTAATGAGTSQRIATAPNLTVARYLRVVTTGTFTNAQFAVVICRNPVAVTF